MRPEVTVAELLAQLRETSKRDHDSHTNELLKRVS